MRKKVYRVKHYKSYYNKRRSNVWAKIIATASAIAVLFALSYFLLGPITDWLYITINNDSSDSSDISGESSVPSGESSVPSGESSNADSSDSTGNVEIVPSIATESYVFYAKQSDIKDAALYDQFILGLKEDGYKAVVLPIKDHTGDLLFESENTYLEGVNFSQKTSVKELIEKLKTAKIQVIAEISVFKDYKITRNAYVNPNINDMAVLYRPNPMYLWFDDASEIGGDKAWVNPASSKVKEYYTTIIKEVCDLGVDNILLTHFSFSSNSSYKTNAIYTSDDTNLDKAAILRDFYSTLKEAAGETPIITAVDSDELSKKEASHAYGSDVLSLNFDHVCITLKGIDDTNYESKASQIAEYMSGREVKSYSVYIAAETEKKAEIYSFFKDMGLVIFK